MSLPPTSHKPTDDEVVAHYTEIARVGLPIIAYNNPFSTRVDLTPPLLARLAEIEQEDGARLGLGRLGHLGRRVLQVHDATAPPGGRLRSTSVATQVSAARLGSGVAAAATTEGRRL